MSALVILMRTVWTQPSQTTAFEFRLSNYFFLFSSYLLILVRTKSFVKYLIFSL